MTISYAITASTEATELERLLNQLLPFLKEEDEVIIQIDSDNNNEETIQVAANSGCKFHFYSLNKDFASFKNHLLKQCTKEYIFFIDADEYLGEFLLEHLKSVLEINSDIECMVVPRVNKVEGITYGHIKKWGWSLDMENRINFPDYQTRICKNNSEIHWVNKVHERLEGYKTISNIPDSNEWALQHIKTIEKQEKQNALYESI